MARKPTKKAEFVLFDVIYEDGSQRSNRRVPADALTGIEGENAARAIIEQQDREIAAKSGHAPLRIKSLRRTGAKLPEKEWKRRALLSD
ncbi:MAG: hypothetical protein F9K38_05330 [Pseudorhodoplanes sp.]|nr:MAG: hypothetical protein F9K38_05330 [Pseudorhodoplanes sp.]